MLFLAAVLVGSVGSFGTGQGEPSRIRVGQTLEVPDARATITFEAVRSDSRCPKATQCIRAGEAVVALTWRDGKGESTVLTLNVPPGRGATRIRQGYAVEILRLDPEAEPNVRIAQGDYVATVRVRKQ